MAKLEKCEALIVRSIRYKESDTILHLFTREAGRRSAVAPRARTMKSTLRGRLEPFARVELVLRQGRSDMANVASVNNVDAHVALRSRYQEQATAAAGFGMLVRLFGEREQNVDAYNLTCHFLNELDTARLDAQHQRALLVGYQLKLLVTAGLAPQLSNCVRCGSEADAGRWSAQDGGLVCAECAAVGDAVLAPEVLAAARWLLGRSLQQIAQVETVPDSETLAAVSRSIVSAICVEHGGFRAELGAVASTAAR